jgi:nucleoside-diphosphate-sugar epimerase
MSMMFKKVLVTGGAGYVGSRLVPELLKSGIAVNVLDLCIYGKGVLACSMNHPHFKLFEGDLRNLEMVYSAIKGCDAVIHLACISNDPSFELNPDLGKSINFDAFGPLVDAALAVGVKRFVYASSSSVYGVKQDPKVTEELPLEPLTDYSKFKALCEDILLAKCGDKMVPLIVRPATVCGVAPRLRLDLVVNILTAHAFHNKKMRVFGGEQLRPNIHIADMVDFYCKALQWNNQQIAGTTYNVGYENFPVSEIAATVKKGVSQLGGEIQVSVEASDDPRSYHVSSSKAAQELGFTPQHSLDDAVAELIQVFRSGTLHDPMHNSLYYNIKRMQELSLS